MVSEIDYFELGKTIRLARSMKKLTQEQLAEITNMSTTHISNIENGKTKISLSAIFSISNALGYTIEELITGDINQDREETVQNLESMISSCTYYERKVIFDTVNALKISMIKNRKIH